MEIMMVSFATIGLLTVLIMFLDLIHCCGIPMWYYNLKWKYKIKCKVDYERFKNVYLLDIRGFEKLILVNERDIDNQMNFMIDFEDGTTKFFDIPCCWTPIEKYKEITNIYVEELRRKLAKQRMVIKELRQEPKITCYMKDIGMAKLYNEKYWYYIPSSDCNTVISQDEYDKLSEKDKQKYMRIGG